MSNITYSHTTIEWNGLRMTIQLNFDKPGLVEEFKTKITADGIDG
jgi:hypothetical protein